MSMFEMMRRQAEKLYDSTCNITEMQLQSGVINKYVEGIVAENIPCRLSYKASPNSNNGNMTQSVSQSIKLFLQPDLVVKAGSKIAVNHRGVYKDFESSGMPRVYISHQEIELIAKEGNA